jgi:hypothetical protein
MANLSAQDDYKQIKNNECINHKVQWLVRATVTFLLVICLVTFHNLLLPNSWLIAVYYSLVAAFWFSMIFRYKLNTLRRLSVFYISKSNIYDSVFIILANKNGGKLAYIFELTLVITLSILSVI